jgi:hypothetical protein
MHRECSTDWLYIIKLLLGRNSVASSIAIWNWLTVVKHIMWWHPFLDFVLPPWWCWDVFNFAAVVACIVWYYYCVWRQILENLIFDVLFINHFIVYICYIFFLHRNISSAALGRKTFSFPVCTKAKCGPRPEDKTISPLVTQTPTFTMKEMLYRRIVHSGLNVPNVTFWTCDP